MENYIEEVTAGGSVNSLYKEWFVTVPVSLTVTLRQNNVMHGHADANVSHSEASAMRTRELAQGSTGRNPKWIPSDPLFQWHDNQSKIKFY